MNPRLLLLVLYVLTFGGPQVFAQTAARREKPTPGHQVKAISPELQAYLSNLKRPIFRNFQIGITQGHMFYLRPGRATAVFTVRADGQVENLHFEDVTPHGGSSVVYAARRAILDETRGFGPFPAELRRTLNVLNIRCEFTNRGIRSINGADPTF